MRIGKRGWAKGHGAPAVAALALLAPPATAVAQYQPIHGAPPHTAGVGGYMHSGGTTLVNNSGTVVGGPNKLDAAGTDIGQRAVRWDASSGGELPLLGAGSDGSTDSGIDALNHAGAAAGWAAAFDGNGNALGTRAVRWSASGTIVPLGLPAPGFADSGGLSFAFATTINESDVTAGELQRSATADGAALGMRPVRWDASGAVQVLQTVTDDTIYHVASSSDINAAGTVVGNSQKIIGSLELGGRAIRWNAGSATAIELDILSAKPDGSSNAEAVRIIADGTVFGGASVNESVTGADRGARAVRWDAGATTIHVLEELSVKADGTSEATMQDANDAGVSVGMAELYDVAGDSLGPRAVRWDASGDITQLGILDADANGVSTSQALSVNLNGEAVGHAAVLEGTDLIMHATYWGTDGVAIDLNSLIDPASGWERLSMALSISDTGWIAGEGFFDPDGVGGVDAYPRQFLMQVPEPGGLSLLAISVGALLRRRNRFTR